LCDRVLLLNHGEQVTIGKPKDVIPIYKDFFDNKKEKKIKGIKKAKKNQAQKFRTIVKDKTIKIKDLKKENKELNKINKRLKRQNNFLKNQKLSSKNKLKSKSTK